MVWQLPWVFFIIYFLHLPLFFGELSFDKGHFGWEVTPFTAPTSQAIHGLSHLRTQKGSPFTLKGNHSVSRFMSLSPSPGGQNKARPPDTTPYCLPSPLHSHACKLFPERTPSVNCKPLTSCLRLHLERNSLKTLGNKVIRFVF